MKIRSITANEVEAFTIIADIDVDNFPLAKALSRTGYKETRTIWAYKMDFKKEVL